VSKARARLAAPRLAAVLLAAVLSALDLYCAAAATAAVGTTYAPVTAGQPLRFPDDLGSHPQFRTEWWYVTGWLATESGEPLGFQITFFRTKPDIDVNNPSHFTPHQIIVAHCALSDPKRGTLWQDQRIRRVALGLAGALEGNTHVWIDQWSLQRTAQTYIAKIAAEDFSFDLALSETQAVLINGKEGVSRKGPQERAASYYYSLPHMRVAGTISRKGRPNRVTGEAWFDHEWSSEYLDAQAIGWDWIGINMQDGGALMAFQIRARDGKPRWAGGTIRSGDGTSHILQPEDVEFRAGRRWTSPRTGIVYPVEWTIRADGKQLRLVPLFDDQENDTRLSTGAIYWEGAVRAFDKLNQVGRGYLELTGYGEPLRLR
jgi:predicted secreted hydrolase